MSDWEENKTQVLARLRRAEGQLRAVIGMVDKEDDCERVAQQLSATRKALDRAFYDMVACAMQREFAGLGLSSRAAKDQLKHMTGLLTRFG